MTGAAELQGDIDRLVQQQHRLDVAGSVALWVLAGLVVLLILVAAVDFARGVWGRR